MALSSIIRTIFACIGGALFVLSFFPAPVFAQADERPEAIEEVQTATRFLAPYTVEFRVEGNGTLAGAIREISLLHEHAGEGAVPLATIRSRMERDIRRTRALLRSEGYYQPEILNRLVREGGAYNVILEIIPGPRYVFAAPDFSFQGPAPAGETVAKARESMDLKAGEPARAETVLAAEAAALRAFGRMGHPFVRALTRDVMVDHAMGTMTVTYAFDTGARTVFGPLVFDGLKTVEQDYLRRFKTWEEGEPYDQAKVERFRENLVRTGLFDQVQTRPRPPQDGAEGGHTAPLVVTVTESAHRSVGLGGGFTTSEGFGFEATWEHRNLLGSQERLLVTATLAEIEQGLSARITKPNFLRLDQSISGEASALREDTDAFNALSLDANGSIERRLLDWLSVSAGVDGKFTDIEEIEGIRRQFFLVHLPVGLRVDTTDNVFDPQKGYRARLVIQPGTTLIDDEFLFLVNELTASAYQRVDAINTVFAARTRLGMMEGPETLRIPASERFFAGGGGSIRGFDFQEVGPKNAEGNPTGGRSVAEVGFEARIRASRTIGIVPFIAGGNVYFEQLPQFTDFRWGAGLGLRYHTTFAPIRLDVAFPVDRRAGEPHVQFYLSIGQSF